MHFYDKTTSVGCTNLKSHCCGVGFSVVTDYTTTRAIMVTSEWRHKNQNFSYRGKF